MTRLHSCKVFICGLLFILPSFLIPVSLLAEQKLYWADSSSVSPAIRCIDSSKNSCVDKANPSNTVLFNLSPGTYIGGIALDEKNQKVIFTNSGNPGKIQAVNMDGSGSISDIITDAGNTPTHLAFDSEREKLYWTSFDGVYSSKLDGSSKGLINTISSYSFQGIAVDHSLDRLVWMEGFSGSLKTLNYSDLTTYIPTALTTFPTADVYGITIDESLSPLSRIIWAPYEGSTSAQLTYYLGYTSSQPTVNILNSLSGANSFGYGSTAVDFPEANLFYANKYDGIIFKTSLIPAGASQDTYVTSTGEVTGMVFSCGRNAPDNDQDGTNYCNDLCDDDETKTAPGLCACGEDESEDSDGDKSPDCADECVDDENKTAPGTCGCGNPEPDGSCACGLLEDINSDGKLVCVKTRQLAPNTIIETPPVVEVNDGEVIIILEKFTKPTLTLKKKKKKKTSSASPEFYDYSVEIRAGGLKVTYDIQITKVGGTKRDIKKLTSKRNELAVKNLAPGNYNVKYRAVITQNGEPAAKTKFSPDANFTIE